MDLKLVCIFLLQILFSSAQDCLLTVPAFPLSANGLATPHLLVLGANAPCTMNNKGSQAFVQGAVIDTDTGQISVYNPIVIDTGTQPAIKPTPPALPVNPVVALWFGFNGATLTLQGPGLDTGACVGGGPGIFGQFSYCNAPQFFQAAYAAIAIGKLTVPPLGIAVDGMPCPTTRDYFVVDMDPSDNVLTNYIVTNAGLVAQNTAANRLALANTNASGNGSDEGLVDNFLNPALNCQTWKVPDLADPGSLLGSLPTNELQANQYQKNPVALVSPGDPMCLDTTDPVNPKYSAAKTNLYRLGVGQPLISYVDQELQLRVINNCKHLGRIAPLRYIVDTPYLTAAKPPTPGGMTVALNLLGFLAQRYQAAYGPYYMNNQFANGVAGGLNCTVYLGATSTPIVPTIDAATQLPNGATVTAANIQADFFDKFQVASAGTLSVSIFALLLIVISYFM